MLSYDQAVYFLEKILRMPTNWKGILEENPLEFLSLYLKRHAIRIPFQGLDMAAIDQCNRWFPSEQQLIETGLSGKGGCCLNLNYFTKLVFQAIGLDTFVVRADHYCAPIPGNHCICMVKLNNRIFMVEAGGAYPMLEPVSMDKDKLPYRTTQACGFPYEFREIGEGWIGRFHLGGGMFGEYTDRKEHLRTSWDLKPRQLWEFDYPMMETFTNPSLCALLKTLFLFRFFNNSEFRRFFPERPENFGSLKITGGVVPMKSDAFLATTTNGRIETEDDEDDLEDPENFIFIFKRRMVVGDKKKRKILRDYESYDEMIGDLKNYFPQIPEKIVEKAMNTFKRYELGPSLYDRVL